MTTPASVDGGPDLLPCPLDGCHAYMVFEKLGNPGGLQYEAAHVQTDCGVSGPDGRTTVDAARRWNTRSPSTRDAALREEGRVQERADVLAALRIEEGNARLAWNALTDSASIAFAEARARTNALRGMSMVFEGGSHVSTHQPGASQGSAPVTLPGPRSRTVRPPIVFEDEEPAAPQGSPLPGGGDEDSLRRLTEQAIADRSSRKLARNPPERGALEGELAEALRWWLEWARRYSTVDIALHERLLASYDDAHPPVKERP